MFISTQALNVESLMRLPGLFSSELMFLRIVKLWEGFVAASNHPSLCVLCTVNLKQLRRNPSTFCLSMQLRGLELNFRVKLFCCKICRYCKYILQPNCKTQFQLQEQQKANILFLNSFVQNWLALVHKTELENTFVLFCFYDLCRPHLTCVNPQILLGYNLLC